MDRQEAYKLVQKHAMRAWQERVSFVEGLKSDPAITNLLTPADLQAAFDYSYHFKHIDAAFQRLSLR